MNKETKIPFFMSLTNSSLVKRLTKENLKTHVPFAGKQHQTSHRKENTEITILSQETTNIKKIFKKKKTKITILRKQQSISRSKKTKPSHKKQLTSIHPKKKKKNHLTEKQQH